MVTVKAITIPYHSTDCLFSEPLKSLGSFSEILSHFENRVPLNSVLAGVGSAAT